MGLSGILNSCVARGQGKYINGILVYSKVGISIPLKLHLTLTLQRA